MANREVPRQRLEGDTAQARADRIMAELKATGRSVRSENEAEGDGPEDAGA